MIGRNSGLLAEKNPPKILVDCNGTGFEVPVREDAQILCGFGHAAERAAFCQLTKTSGVGPRTALSVLSGMSVEELSQAITPQEIGRIIKVPGIGKKPPIACWSNSRANSAPTGVSTSIPPKTAGTTFCRLPVALGHSDRDAALALKALPEDVGVSDGIKLALKSLSRP